MNIKLIKNILFSIVFIHLSSFSMIFLKTNAQALLKLFKLFPSLSQKPSGQTNPVPYTWNNSWQETDKNTKWLGHDTKTSLAVHADYIVFLLSKNPLEKLRENHYNLSPSTRDENGMLWWYNDKNGTNRDRKHWCNYFKYFEQTVFKKQD